MRGRPSHTWTEEQKQALRDLWTEERRVALALRRKAHPLGTRSKRWWAEHPAACQEANRRLNGRRSIADLNELFAEIDRAKERLRRLGVL